MAIGLFKALQRLLAAPFQRNQAPTEFHRVPEMDDTQSEIVKAIETGYQNREILCLATAWCQNIDYTRGPFGVGVIESSTGLPVSGGSLRCDFAKAPQRFGALLEANAVAFYEENCVGCSDRVATEATEHLGTWAEAQIAERENLAAKAALAQREAKRASKERAASRRLLHGNCDPATQSILDLVDKVDDLVRDEEAEQSLIKHAELAPGDFPDALVDHLTNEAMSIGNSAFLETTFAIFERQGRPDTDTMLGIAFQAVEKSIAQGTAGRIVAAHAREFDVEPSSLTGFVQIAAGRPHHMFDRWVDAEPAALFRFFECEPEAAVKLISDMLQDTDVWTRACAAHASANLVAAKLPAGSLLLPSLLDSLSFSDDSKYGGDPFAAKQVACVVAEIFIANPKDCDTCLEARIRTADPKLAKNLWDCYDRACRIRFHERLPSHVTDTIVRRSVLLLETDLDTELLRDVADTLSLACLKENVGTALQNRDMVRLVVLWLSRLQRMAKDSPTEENMTTQGFLEAYAERQRVSAILNHLQEVLERVADQNPRAYLSAINPEWNGADARERRVFFLEVLGAIVHDQIKFDLTLPVLRRSLKSRRSGERAAALRVIGRVPTSKVSIPQDVVSRVLEAVDDEKLIVLLGAIRAAQHLEIPPQTKPKLISELLGFCSSYGPQFLYREDVTSAMGLALRLAQGETYEETVGSYVLDTIKAMPSGKAALNLKKLNLENHPGWPVAAVSALRVDSRPEYRDLGEEDRKVLLRKLATKPTAEIAPYFTDLVDIASERLRCQPWWAGYVADVLVFHQEHEQAAALLDKVVDLLPDTPERRPVRNVALQNSLGHRVNAAATRDDQDGVARNLAEWSQLLAEQD